MIPVAVDLTRMPAPKVVEPLDFETILAAMKADLLERFPSLDAVTLESDPSAKILEACAYRELLLRQRVNDAARAVMLAYAAGTDLDNLGPRPDIVRQPGESDARLRDRIQQGYHLLAAAGPASAYRQHALAADTSVADVSVYSPAAGQVIVTVLAPMLVPLDLADPDEALAGSAAFPDLPIPSGQAVIIARPTDPPLLAVLARLNQEDVRPLTDSIVVRSPLVHPVTVEATLILYPGPDPETVLNEAGAALDAYLVSIRRIGFDMTRAGNLGALVVAGVQNVALNSPEADVVAGPTELVLCVGQALHASEARVQ